MQFDLREMTNADFDQALALWQRSEHVELNEQDTPEGFAYYLKRNPGLCFSLYDGSVCIGTILCGNDGRRGILRHLAVDPKYRGQGLGKLLVEAALDALDKAGMPKTIAFVMKDNTNGLSFWQHLGFEVLEETFLTLRAATAR